jgi:hypothetical protein
LYWEERLLDYVDFAIQITDRKLLFALPHVLSAARVNGRFLLREKQGQAFARPTRLEEFGHGQRVWVVAAFDKVRAEFRAGFGQDDFPA